MLAIVVDGQLERWAVGVLAALLVIATGILARGISGPQRAESAALVEDADRPFDQLQLETDLREQILEALDDGILLADSSFRILYSNSAAATLLGSDVIEDLPDQLREADQGVEFTLHYPKRRELRAVSSKLRDGRRLAVVRDVTEARQLDKIRTDFVSNASHELKTPVAAILATAETLSSAARDDVGNVARFSDSLVSEATRLAQLVEDLLHLAKLEGGGPASDPVRLDQVVSDELVVFRHLMEQRGLEMQLDLEPTLTRGDKESLALLVRNLLENAIRYTNHGSVAVRVLNADGDAVLEVQDTGIGIPTDARDRIFERFYRVDSTRSRATGGTGLGLSIVKHVVETHGGNISVVSELGSGSTFTVRLRGENGVSG